MLLTILCRALRRSVAASWQLADSSVRASWQLAAITRMPARPGQSVLPRLEILEDRTVLSTWTVTSPADSGDGSLRAMIAAAQDGDQIVFHPSLQGQTITLTSGQ